MSKPAAKSLQQTEADPEVTGSGPLPGRYKAFFATEFHPLVFNWYHQAADHTQRKNFKRFVKAILSFDAEGAKQKQRVGFEMDIPSAHAIVTQNCGHVLTPEARELAVLYLAVAGQAERQQYRTTFGLIVPPSTTAAAKTKYFRDFGEGTKFMKGEMMHRDTSKPMLCKSAVKPKSVTITAPCEVIGDGKSQYGLFYAWKVAPKLGINVTQKAHVSSQHGAPWGEYGSSNTAQWVPQSKEDFAEHEYRAPTVIQDGNSTTVAMAARRFQNYNDNVSHEVYRTQRLLNKGRRLPGATLAEMTLLASSASPAEMMKPVRAPGPAPSPSPIFCR